MKFNNLTRSLSRSDNSVEHVERLDSLVGSSNSLVE